MPPKSKSELPTVPSLLSTAVTALGGTERTAQLTMASAVAHSIDTGEHLAVQAGTGTGKSLAYLVPSLRHAVTSGKTVVVSTATIALQRQLVDRDLPRLSKALTTALAHEPTFAILKGRGNYLCLNKLHGAPSDAPEEELFDAFAVSRLGREVKRITEWSSDTETGDRDELNPGVSDQAWRQMSVTSRECLGKSRCPYGEDCFAELARVDAARADVVVTNHAMLAIDAITGISVLPEHDVVVVDEAHELVDRVTSAATAEMSATAVGAAMRRCGKLVEDEILDRLAGAAEGFAALLDELEGGRWEELPPARPRRSRASATPRGPCARPSGRPSRAAPPRTPTRRPRGPRLSPPSTTCTTPRCAFSRRTRRAIPRSGGTWCGWPSTSSAAS